MYRLKVEITLENEAEVLKIKIKPFRTGYNVLRELVLPMDQEVVEWQVVSNAPIPGMFKLQMQADIRAEVSSFYIGERKQNNPGPPFKYLI